MSQPSEDIFGGIALGWLLALAMVLIARHTWANSERDYLRRYIQRTSQYTPCRERWMDAAMGVDCGEFTKGRGE